MTSAVNVTALSTVSWQDDTFLSACPVSSLTLYLKYSLRTIRVGLCSSNAHDSYFAGTQFECWPSYCLYQQVFLCLSSVYPGRCWDYCSKMSHDPSSLNMTDKICLETLLLSDYAELLIATATQGLHCPSSVEVKNEQSLTATALFVFMCGAQAPKTFCFFSCVPQSLKQLLYLRFFNLICTFLVSLVSSMWASDPLLVCHLVVSVVPRIFIRNCI
jgi:hypothetical protein